MIPGLKGYSFCIPMKKYDFETCKTGYYMHLGALYMTWLNCYQCAIVLTEKIYRNTCINRLTLQVVIYDIPNDFYRTILPRGLLSKT